MWVSFRWMEWSIHGAIQGNKTECKLQKEKYPPTRKYLHDEIKRIVRNIPPFTNNLMWQLICIYLVLGFCWVGSGRGWYKLMVAGNPRVNVKIMWMKNALWDIKREVNEITLSCSPKIVGEILASHPSSREKCGCKTFEKQIIGRMTILSKQ